jgi:hypothetical protein
MQNYKEVAINYSSQAILDVLQQYPLPRDNSADVTACSKLETQEISKILDLGLPIISILYFRMGRNFSGYIHKDVNLNNPRPTLITHALNLPLSGCKEVYMKWYKQIDINQNEQPFGGPSGGTPTPLLNYNNAICIDQVNCNHTNLVSITDWHAIENRSLEEYGYLISIRFDPYVKTSFDLPMNKWLLEVGSNH